MPEQIRDGSGRGYLAAVTRENRLATVAICIDLRTHISTRHGESYTMNTGALTLSAVDTWHWVLYWVNNSTTHNLHMSNIEFNWNGGSTNFNRPLQARNVIPIAGVPTANYTDVIMSNNNKLVGNTAEMDVYKWNGDSTGMVDVTGPAGSDTFHPQGRSLISFDGWVVSGLGAHVGLQVKAPEIGIFSVGIGLFFIDKGAEL
jgi:hypothetical protein